MLTVFLKEVCRWKQLSHFHLFLSRLSAWEKYRSFLFCSQHWGYSSEQLASAVTQGFRWDSWGSPLQQWKKKKDNSRGSYFYLWDFSKVPGLNSFWLHSSNCFCLFSSHETNHTITLEVELLQLHCLGYVEFPLFKRSHACRPLMESVRAANSFCLCDRVPTQIRKTHSQHVAGSSSGWETT